MSDALVEAQTGEITRENFGDVFMCAYADFLRRHDGHLGQAAEAHDLLGRAYDQLETLITRPAEEEVLTPEQFLRYSKKLGAKILDLKSKASHAEFLSGKMYPRYIDDDERGAELELPGTHKVKVENISDDSGLIVVTSTNEFVSEAVGRIWDMNLSSRSGDAGEFSLAHKRKFRVPVFYYVKSLINREDYTAKVRLTFLED